MKIGHRRALMNHIALMNSLNIFNKIFREALKVLNENLENKNSFNQWQDTWHFFFFVNFYILYYHNPDSNLVLAQIWAVCNPHLLYHYVAVWEITYCSKASMLM